MLKALYRTLVPSGVRRVVSAHRTHARSLELDRAFAHSRRSLTERHMSSLRVVADREAMLRALPGGGVIAEVGVAEGEFSRMLLDICRPEHLHLIDLWAPDSERYGRSQALAIERVADEMEEGRVSVHRGYSWDMLSQLADRSLDLVYIDAAHDYDSVRKDLAAAEPKMKPTGLMAGHDFTRWSSQGINRWGVIEAVNEFCLDRGWEMVMLTNEPHRHLSYVLRKLVDQ